MDYYFNEFLGHTGKMISGSKSGYAKLHKKNAAVFNSNIFSYDGKEYNRVWFGDIDLTLELDNVKKYSNQLGLPLFIFFEQDGRYQYETIPNIGRHLVKVDGDIVELGETYKFYFKLKDGIITLKK